MEDLSSLAFPILQDISWGIDMEMRQFYSSFNPFGTALERLIRHADTHYDWIPETGHGLLYNTGLSHHLGNRGIIFPDRVQDIEGARTVVASSHHSAGLVAATINQKFTLVYKPDCSGRLFLSDAPTPGTSASTKPSPKFLLDYMATTHLVCSMKHQLNSKSTSQDSENGS